MGEHRSTTVEIDGVSYTAEVSSDGGITVRDHSGSFRVEPRGDGSLRVIGPRTISTAHVVETPGGTWVSVDGDVFLVTIGDAGTTRARAHKGDHDLIAPMPATVVRILAQVGKTVVRGELLIALEAMKMELPIRAPRDGTVDAILCKEGELVRPNVPLLTLT